MMGLRAHEITGFAPRQYKLVPPARPASRAAIIEGFHILEGATDEAIIIQQPRGKPTPSIVVRARIADHELLGVAHPDTIILGAGQLQPLPEKPHNKGRTRGA